MASAAQAERPALMAEIGHTDGRGVPRAIGNQRHDHGVGQQRDGVVHGGLGRRAAGQPRRRKSFTRFPCARGSGVDGVVSSDGGRLRRRLKGCPRADASGHVLDRKGVGCYRDATCDRPRKIMDPQQQQAADTFDAYRDTYSDAVDDAVRFSGLRADFFTRVKAEYLLEETRAHFGDLASVQALDVGCGVGNFHPLLSPRLGELHGVDVSQDCLDTARKCHPDIVYRSYDGDRLPYDDASFDLAFAICVLHHVPTANWETFTRELFRVVRPGGLALIFEHNPLNPLTMRVVNRCPFDADAVLLKSRDTQRLLTTAGFADLRARFILSIPAGTRWLRRIDRLASRLPLGAQYFLAGTRP